MSAPVDFSFDEWKDGIARTSGNRIDISDDLHIDFDEDNRSSTCIIKISNLGNTIIRTPKLCCNPFVFEIRTEPAEKLIPPFGSVFYSITANHEATTPSTTKNVKFVFSNGYTESRPIQINYSGNQDGHAKNSGRRKRRIFEVPKVFVEAKRPTLNPKDTIDAVDGLMPSYEGLMYLNYDKHFQGLLYLEELNLINLYKRFKIIDIYFRENGSFYEFDYENIPKPTMAIGKF